MDSSDKPQKRPDQGVLDSIAKTGPSQKDTKAALNSLTKLPGCPEDFRVQKSENQAVHDLWKTNFHENVIKEEFKASTGAAYANCLARIFRDESEIKNEQVAKLYDGYVIHFKELSKNINEDIKHLKDRLDYDAIKNALDLLPDRHHMVSAINILVTLPGCPNDFQVQKSETQAVFSSLIETDNKKKEAGKKSAAGRPIIGFVADFMDKIGNELATKQCCEEYKAQFGKELALNKNKYSNLIERRIDGDAISKAVASKNSENAKIAMTLLLRTEGCPKDLRFENEENKDFFKSFKRTLANKVVSGKRTLANKKVVEGEKEYSVTERYARVIAHVLHQLGNECASIEIKSYGKQDVEEARKALSQASHGVEPQQMGIQQLPMLPGIQQGDQRGLVPGTASFMMPAAFQPDPASTSLGDSFHAHALSVKVSKGLGLQPPTRSEGITAAGSVIPQERTAAMFLQSPAGTPSTSVPFVPDPRAAEIVRTLNEHFSPAQSRGYFANVLTKKGELEQPIRDTLTHDPENAIYRSHFNQAVADINTAREQRLRQPQTHAGITATPSGAGLSTQGVQSRFADDQRALDTEPIIVTQLKALYKRVNESINPHEDPACVEGFNKIVHGHLASRENTGDVNAANAYLRTTYDAPIMEFYNSAKEAAAERYKINWERPNIGAEIATRLIALDKRVNDPSIDNREDPECVAGFKEIVHGLLASREHQKAVDETNAVLVKTNNAPVLRFFNLAKDAAIELHKIDWERPQVRDTGIDATSHESETSVRSLSGSAQRPVGEPRPQLQQLQSRPKAPNKKEIKRVLRDASASDDDERTKLQKGEHGRRGGRPRPGGGSRV